jgi:plastocyanin
MATNRRTLLRALGATAASASLAGCSGFLDGGSDGSGGRGSASAETAVAIELNAMRARVDDALALGLAGEGSAGASVAGSVFERFENAGGEWGAHEQLESTSKEDYEGFESALGKLESSLEAGETDVATGHAETANDHLASAQEELVGTEGSHALDLLHYGAATGTMLALTEAGKGEAAATVGDRALSRFEAASVHGALEDADGETYETFESKLTLARDSATQGKPSKVRGAATATMSAAVSGAYALTNEDAADAAHVGAMQARAWDASALARLGGPGEAYAHAGTLTTYRARVADASMLARNGGTDVAATMAGDVYAHFEGAKAHEGLEDADREAYEGFEGGLETMRDAAKNGNAENAASAAATVDEHLLAGVEALAGDTGAAMLEASYFKARLGDARELYGLGGTDQAAAIAGDLYERFEKDEAGFHEAFEHADAEAYESFEAHLEKLKTAFAEGDDAGVEEQYAETHEYLMAFETTAGSTAHVGGAEAAFLDARVFDAATVAQVGSSSRATAVAEGSFAHFEGGAGGFHEGLEDADHELYESFEGQLEAVIAAAESGGDVYAAAKQYDEKAIAAAYAMASGSGGEVAGAAAELTRDVYASFEEAAVHESLEEADTEAYETFEAKLEALTSAIESGGDVQAAASAFADASLQAQFAVVGAAGKAPTGSGSGESEESEDTDLSGGPNVQQGVPEDADHVVEMTAAAFEPAELTVQTGDTVAWKHVEGEAHTVSALGEKIPEGAAYWASGDFGSREKAESGWENGKGAVQSGQSYVHTFETGGEHYYDCIPHAAAGMEGEIVVEE